MKRTVLVTGGNRGIGLAIVKEMAKETTDLILLGCRDFKQGSKLAGELGENIIAVSLNLSSRLQLDSDIRKIKVDYQSIDVLINNAGVLNEGGFDSVSLGDFDESLRVNTVAAYELIRAFVPEMKIHNYGRIVNISSGWGSFDDGLTGPFGYSVSKAAMNALTMTMAQALPGGIKINSMCPGWVRTRMGGMAATRSPEEGAETAVWLANLDDDGPTGGFFRDKKPIKW